MIDGKALLLRLKVCTNCFKHLRRHCPYCWACDENHRCDRRPTPLEGGRRPRTTENGDGDLDAGS